MGFLSNIRYVLCYNNTNIHFTAESTAESFPCKNMHMRHMHISIIFMVSAVIVLIMLSPFLKVNFHAIDYIILKFRCQQKISGKRKIVSGFWKHSRFFDKKAQVSCNFYHR